MSLLVAPLCSATALGLSIGLGIVQSAIWNGPAAPSYVRYIIRYLLPKTSFDIAEKDISEPTSLYFSFGRPFTMVYILILTAIAASPINTTWVNQAFLALLSIAGAGDILAYWISGFVGGPKLRGIGFRGIEMPSITLLIILSLYHGIKDMLDVGASTTDGLLPVQDAPTQRKALSRTRMVSVAWWVAVIVALAIGGSLAGYFVFKKRSGNGSSGSNVSTDATGGHPSSGSKKLLVVLSVGGDKASPYDFIKGDGVQIGNMIYNTFLGGNATNRPFGNAVFDGIELDIEKTRPGYTEEMISLLQTIKKLSPSTLLSAVPQCYLNDDTIDANTGPVIQSHPELLDYIIVQYYNNPTCSYPFGFNFDLWTKRYKGPIVVGLAGNETSAITGGFLNAGQLQAVVDMIYNNTQFYGISVYDVSSANLSPYAHTMRDVLDGKVVGSGYPPQGPPQDESNYATRCGPTWNYANATCNRLSIPCVPGNSCGSQQCFTFLQKC
ncbi:UNVERIFIED_CONTAM: hypothetical protein HDU68_004455 [Siphonaria sp. JEL0065]|nr:hypothetical protein HDU68_004455 [Siphonaria sp. JEL0065]